MDRLFVGVRYIRLNLESRNKFPLLEMGGALAYVRRLFWVGEGINNVEAENKFPLLDIVDGIWYGAMLCRRKTTQMQNQIGLGRGWKEGGKSWDWEIGCLLNFGGR